MLGTHSRLIIGAIGAACAALGHAAPVIIDSEQKAQAALVTTMGVPQQTTQELRGATDFARGKVEDALKQLAAATTPATLARSRDGIRLPCGVSGELAASLTRGYPRTLILRWSACRYVDIDGRSRGRDGLIEVLLLSDSFTPERVAGIRVGSATTDFLETRHIDEDGQITDESNYVNLRITGLIPMIRAFPLYGYFVGAFVYEQTGFTRGVARYEYPIGAPIQTSDSMLAFDHVMASGALTYNDAKTFLTENLQLHWGTVTREAAYTGSPDSTGSYTVDNLQLRSETDFTSWTQKQWLNGRIDYEWRSDFPSACLSGPYSFRTTAPLNGPAFSGVFESGNLLINEALRAQFYSAANTPPAVPVPQQGMLINLRAPAAGNFTYDVPNVYSMNFSSGCF
jgi:hypothetical protein